MPKILKNKRILIIAGATLLVASAGLVLAQSLGYFPRYPNRISNLVKELALAGDDLVYFNEELKSLTDECNCKNTQSQCGQISAAAASVKRIEMNPFKFTGDTPEAALSVAIDELNRTKSQVSDSLNGLNAFIYTTKQQSLLKPKTYGVKIESDDPQEEIDRSLRGSETEIALSVQELNQVENRIKNLKVLDSSITNQQNILNKLKNETSKYDPENFKKEVENSLKETENSLNQQLSKITDFPQQLQNKLLSMADSLTSRIENFPDEIKNALTPSACREGSQKVLGGPCKNEKLIEKTQQDITDKTDHINYLRNLLIAEMKSGLDDELKTLREDEAKELKASLDKILADSEKIISPASDNLAIIDDDKYAAQKQCNANCDQGMVMGLQACLLKGEQGKIKLKYKIGVELEDLDLGKIGIKSASINLPDKIEIGGIDKFKEFRIPLPDAIIDYPDLSAQKKTFSMNPIVIHPPSFSLPIFPLGNYSCPQITASSYSCQGQTGEKTPQSYINLQWYLETFSFLSEKCEEIPEINDKDGLPDQEHIKKCLDKNNVQNYIVQQCDTLWNQYLSCILTKPLGLGSSCDLPTGICEEIKKPSQRNEAIANQCVSLFGYSNQPAPMGCDIEDLENECLAMKEVDKSEDVPEPCMYLPVFTGKLENPNVQTFEEGSDYCPSQTISDVSGVEIRADCPLPFSGQADLTPKLKLPTIKIPDIKLPTFSFMPFVKVKLPSFIFEDLSFDNLLFCNYKDCLDILPPVNLNLPYPTLRIPSINLPSRRISVPTGLDLGDIFLDINMDKIDFPPIPIPMPKIDLMKLISLDYELPKIPIPKPKIILDFQGLEVDAFNILLGLVAGALNLPSGCIGAGVGFIPLIISYPDFYFYWPRFPEIPDLCNNKYININNFCNKVKDSLDPQIYSQLAKIQKAIDSSYAKIQKPLDQISTFLEKIVQEKINGALDQAEAKIKEEAGKRIQKALAEAAGKNEEDVRECKSWCEKDCEEEQDYRKECEDECKKGCEPLKLSGSDFISIPLDDIVISEEDLKPINDILAKIPKEIPLNWPDDTKKINLCQESQENQKNLNECYDACDLTCSAFDDDESITSCQNWCLEDCDSEIGKKKCPMYPLPPIPLKGLGYVKEKEIPLPGLQKDSFSLSISGLGGYPSCSGATPSGGNPYPMGKMQENTNNVKNFSNEIEKSMEEISDILD